jgi:hypothetical protein
MAPPPPLRVCQQDSDCAAVNVTRCCGYDLYMGVSVREASGFPAREACPQTCGTTDCFEPIGAVDDEGSYIGNGKVALSCVDGQCRTKVDLPRFPCGKDECLKGDYCDTRTASDGSSQSSCHIGNAMYSDCAMLPGPPCTCRKGPEAFALRVTCPDI